MGTYYSTYIGPYIVVRNKHIKIPKTRNIFKSESGKIHKTKINFDPVDGSPVHQITEQYEQLKSIGDWWELTELANDKDIRQDNFWTPAYCPEKKGHTFWIPQEKGIGIVLENYTLKEVPINEEFISSQKEMFENKMEKQISFAKSHFEDMEICFGIIPYGN